MTDEPIDDIQALKLKLQIKRKRMELAAQAQQAAANPMATALNFGRAVGQGFENTFSGVAGTAMDAGAALSGGGTPGADYQRQVQAQQAPVPATPLNQAGQFAGGAAPYFLSGNIGSGLKGALMTGGAQGMAAGAVNNPGERLAGAAIGAPVGAATAGLLYGTGSGVQLFAARVKPILAVADKIKTDLTAIIDRYLPKGQQGFASDLLTATRSRLASLSNAKQRIWSEGMAAARAASGGRVIVRNAPNLEQAILEELSKTSIQPGFANDIWARAQRGFGADDLSEVMTILQQKASSTSRDFTQGGLNALRRGLDKDMANASGAGASELLAMRSAYKDASNQVRDVEKHLLKKVFGVKSVDAAGDVPAETVLNKFAALKPQERAGLATALDSAAPDILEKGQAALLQDALNNSKRIFKPTGETVTDPVSTMQYLADKGEGMIPAGQLNQYRQTLGAMQGLIDRDLKGAGTVKLPWDGNRIINILKQSPGMLLARVRTGRSLQWLATSPEGQQTLATLTRIGPGQRITAAQAASVLSPQFISMLQDEGIMEKQAK